MLAPFAYVRASSLKDAARRLKAEGAYAHAGGTDLLSCLRDHVFEAGTVVSLSDLTDLKGVRASNGGLSIGALTTLTEVERHPEVRGRYAALSQAASEVASPQLRHQGTLGGNLCQKPRCWYYRGEFHCLRKGGDTCFAVDGENQFHCILGGAGCYIVHPSDTAPALVALEATVRTQGRKRRTLPVESFHMPPSEDFTRETVLAPGEIVAEIVLPKVPEGLVSRYRKVRARRAWDFAVAGLALAAVMDGDRVERIRACLSGAAPVPWRSKALEEAVTGRRLDRATAAEAARAAMADAEPLAKNGYKVPLFEGLITEELLALRG